jgi:hypothetical protein
MKKHPSTPSISKNEAQVKFGPNSILVEIPLKTISEANCFENWRLKHKRHRMQQRTVAYFLYPIKDKLKLPCRLIFTRYAPRKLDKHDNLPMSFKYIVDAVCSILTGNFVSGRADDDERITIEYDQVLDKVYGIKIEFVGV